jgi:alpha-tubulin suppressor-like RCC1 family protein
MDGTVAQPDAEGGSTPFDASTSDGSPPEASPLADGSSEGAVDAAAVDAAEGGSACNRGIGAVGIVGCPCASPGVLACAGNAQKVSVVCSGGVWTYASACPSGQNCNSTVGTDQGTCANIDPSCADAGIGGDFCSAATTVAQCSPDLISHAPLQTCTIEGCEAGAPPDNHCNISSCEAGVCTNVCVPGTTRCASGTRVESCDAVGHWQPSDCPYACIGAAVGVVGGTCGGVCVPGAACTTPCLGGTPGAGTCNDQGACVATDATCNPACHGDGDCAGSQFCWQGACVTIKAVSVGGGSSCALASSGAVQCWGFNNIGTLGNNSTTRSPTPVPVFGLSSGVTAISIGQWQVCALTTGDAVLCWGSNNSGELGIGSTAMSSLVPAKVTGLPAGIASIAAGPFETCAITSQGDLWCWGGNGALGTGTSVKSSNVPVDISRAGYVSGVAIGYGHVCALNGPNAASCWGGGSGYLAGALANGTAFSYDVPYPATNVPAPPDGVTAVTAGESDTCFLTISGQVLCSGFNQYGEIGNGTTKTALAPVPVSVLTSGVTAISAANYSTCALTTAGAVYCWGGNGGEILGNDSSASSDVPVPLAGLSSGVASIALAPGYGCVVTTAGRVKCWGGEGDGALGNGATDGVSPTPVDVVEP